MEGNEIELKQETEVEPAGGVSVILEESEKSTTNHIATNPVNLKTETNDLNATGGRNHTMTSKKSKVTY